MSGIAQSHEIYIGDKIESALQILEEESDEYYHGELQNARADHELELEVELRGYYLHVSVDTDTDREADSR